jgi:hypothetical protein
MMHVAFVGSFAARLTEPVRARLSLPCEIIADDEASIIPRLGDVDVAVSMGFTARMAEAAPRLRLVQVPGAGLDRIRRIDRIGRGALRPATMIMTSQVSGWTEGMLEARSRLIADTIARPANGARTASGAQAANGEPPRDAIAPVS